ncbi:hypothetical protein ACFSQ7_15035 [Paenibacillus rhizoplanae]
MYEVEFMTSQLSTQFEQVLTNTITLSQDQSVRGYPYILKFGDQYSKYEMKLTIIDKLAPEHGLYLLEEYSDSVL